MPVTSPSTDSASSTAGIHPVERMRAVSATWRLTSFDRGDPADDSRISPRNPNRSAIMPTRSLTTVGTAAPDVVDTVSRARAGRQDHHGRRHVAEVDVIPDGIQRPELDRRRAIDHRVAKQPRGPSRQGRRRHPGTDRIEDAGNDRVHARLGGLAHQLEGRELRGGVRGRCLSGASSSVVPAGAGAYSAADPRWTRRAPGAASPWPRGSSRPAPRSPATARPRRPPCDRRR